MASTAFDSLVKDFLGCKAESGCSWGWRSILCGKELLRKGLAWRLGDGDIISGFGHQWIPQAKNPYLASGCPRGVNNLRLEI